MRAITDLAIENFLKKGKWPKTPARPVCGYAFNGCHRPAIDDGHCREGHPAVKYSYPRWCQ